MKERSGEKNRDFYEIAKAMAISIAVTLVLILILALVLNYLEIPDAIIIPVNQAIKVVSLVTGALISFREKRNGWRKGLILGVFYIAVAFVVFSLLNKSFEFDISLGIDIVLGGVMGTLSGIIAVNIGGSKM